MKPLDENELEIKKEEEEDKDSVLKPEPENPPMLSAQVTPEQSEDQANQRHWTETPNPNIQRLQDQLRRWQAEEGSLPEQAKEKPIAGWDTPANYLKAIGLSTLDLPIDLVTKLTGLDHLDDKYDKLTAFENTTTQSIREAAAIIIPNIIGAGAVGSVVNATKLVGLSKALANIGGNALMSSSIMGISDYSEKADNIPRTLVDIWPETFGPDGTNPIPADWVTWDGDSVEVRRKKNMLEETVLSGFADILGYTFQAGKPAMKWFNPKNKTAVTYKKKELLKHIDDNTKKTLIDLDNIIEDPWASPTVKKDSSNTKNKLLNQVETTGSSDVTGNPGEAYIRQQQKSRQLQLDLDGEDALRNDPNGKGFNASITPELANEGSITRQSIPPGAVPLNAAQNASIALDGAEGTPVTLSHITKKFKRKLNKIAKEIGKNPGTDPKSLIPDPIVADTTIAKGFGIEDPWIRESVREQTVEHAKAGEYYTTLLNKRRSQKDMAEGAWIHYRNFIDSTRSTKDLKELYISQKESRKLIGETSRLEEPVAVFSEAQAIGAGYALRDLINVYLSRDVNEQSARFLKTTSNEITDFAKAGFDFPGYTDKDKILADIHERLGWLVEEYGLNKYLSGWSLQNKGWWGKLTGDTREDFAGLTVEQFKQVRVLKKQQWDEFSSKLTSLTASNPRLKDSLIEAYLYSNGNIDTLDKLFKFGADQVSVMGMIKSPDPRQMNLFARGMWSVIYNNTLSGLSGLRAAAGNGTMMVLKPLSSILSHGLESVVKQDIEPIQKALYFYSSVNETTRRALSDGIQRMKMVHDDADFMNKVLRKDYVIKDDKAWDVLDGLAEQWEKSGEIKDLGNLYQYRWAKWNWNISKMKWFRTGTTLMSGVDGMTDTFMATLQSRVRAYDQVVHKYGRTLDPKKFWNYVKEAEEVNYANMFTKEGLLSDEAAKNASSEVALNLDDDISGFINTATTSVPALKNFFMFPRTGVNMAKLALSYTPISAIPGMNKYAKILHAGDDIKLITEALAEHGIKNLKDQPTTLALYQNLKREYQGRLLLSHGTAILYYNYALAGNIRGNGPVNNSDRRKLRNMGWKSKTIKVGDNWVSFEGIPMLDSVLTLVGDLAYYSTDIGASITQTNLDKLAWTLSATYLNNTPLYGLEPLQAAFTGDESALKRIMANLARGAIPMSGALGVVSNAITSAQKEIYNDFYGYVANRLPVFSSTLPLQIDFWTGKPLNDIDNPLLRGLNAISPIKFSQGVEPWRLWLMDSGFDGPGLITRTKDGHEYTATEKQALGEIIGQMQLWKKIEWARQNKKFNHELETVRKLYRTNSDYELIRKHKEGLDVYQYLNRVMNDAISRAEFILLNDPKYATIAAKIRASEIMKKAVKTKNVEKLGEINEKTNKDLKKAIEEINKRSKYK